MVDGQQIKPLTGTLTVVDLDGTLVRGNTLHIYIICAVKMFMRRRHFGKLAKTLGYLAARQLRFITHRRMKFGILALVEPDDRMRAHFVSRVSKAKRTWLTQELEQRRASGAHILLATAAADTYIPLLWEGPYVATPVAGNPQRTECRGTDKRKLVERYAHRHHLRISTVITDHSDDLPLLSLPDVERILVCPSASLRTAVTMANLPCTIRTD